MGDKREMGTSLISLQFGGREKHVPKPKCQMEVPLYKAEQNLIYVGSKEASWKGHQIGAFMKDESGGRKQKHYSGERE